MWEFTTTFQEFYNWFLSQTKILTKDKDLSAKVGSLPLSDALFCLDDVIRTRIRCQALSEAIDDLLPLLEKPLHVVDAGCGTGVLGIRALLHWAGQATFIDNNPDTIALCEALLEHYELRDKAIVLCADAKSMRLFKPYDILVSETLCADLVSEDFLTIVQNLKRQGGWEAIIIPQELRIDAVSNSQAAERTIITQDEERESLHLKPEDVTLTVDLTLYDTIHCPNDLSPLFMNPRVVKANTSHPLIVRNTK